MTVTLNHTIIPARDNELAARFFAHVLGLQQLPTDGIRGHFVPVRVNEQLTVQFLTASEFEPHHLAFDVDPQTFDAIVTRIRAAGISFGNSPFDQQNGRTDHPLCARGLFFRDENGHLYEVMSSA